MIPEGPTIDKTWLLPAETTFPPGGCFERFWQAKALTGGLSSVCVMKLGFGEIAATLNP